jgi:hypothetical protein
MTTFNLKLYMSSPSPLTPAPCNKLNNSVHRQCPVPIFLKPLQNLDPLITKSLKLDSNNDSLSSVKSKDMTAKRSLSQPQIPNKDPSLKVYDTSQTTKNVSIALTIFNSLTLTLTPLAERYSSSLFLRIHCHGL